jgi:hypothetical protein
VIRDQALRQLATFIDNRQGLLTRAAIDQADLNAFWAAVRSRPAGWIDPSIESISIDKAASIVKHIIKFY